MRLAYLAILMLAACSEGPDTGAAWVGTYRGQEQDALCVAREGEALKAGFVTYGPGNVNCSISGRAEIRGGALMVVPRGDSDCSIEVLIANGVVSLGTRSQACAYYCGPGADYSGRELLKAPDATKVTDFGGDPLC